MEKLTFNEFAIARDLLLLIENQTVIQTILAGSTPGEIHVDNKKSPRYTFAQFKQRVFLSGDPLPGVEHELENFIQTEIHDHCRNFDVPFFRLTVNHPQWFRIIKNALGLTKPILTEYHCYQKMIKGKIKNIDTPKDFEIKPVNQAMIESIFPGKEDLLDEMGSERESIEAFLEKSFGVAAFRDDALAGWCLSEYNHKDQCEVGIATLPPYQKMGLAKAMTHHFSNQAFQNGIKKILWHCFESNIPSRRTALSTGFSLADRHTVMMLYWDPALNFAVQGNISFENGNYEEALTWYQKALMEDSFRIWMVFKAACAAVHLDRSDTAFKFLEQAIKLGFNDLDYLVSNKHLEPLKNQPKWGEIITQLNLALISKS